MPYRGKISFRGGRYRYADGTFASLAAGRRAYRRRGLDPTEYELQSRGAAPSITGEARRGYVRPVMRVTATPLELRMRVAASICRLDTRDPFERHLAIDRPLDVAAYTLAVERCIERGARPGTSGWRRSFAQAYRHARIAVYASVTGYSTSAIKWGLREGYLSWRTIVEALRVVSPKAKR